MTVRFLHTADLHLGSQLKTQHRQATGTIETLDSAIYTAVERLFDTAIEEEATLVVGAAPEFDDLSEDIELHQIRESPV